MTSNEHPHGRGEKTILVVEDEAIISKLLCEVLESEGFETISRPSADLALAYLAQDAASVSLILTDINMPGAANGADLANQSVIAWPEIPLIVMSGLETPESAGITADVSFIRKPFAIVDILQVVRQKLRGQASGSS